MTKGDIRIIVDTTTSSGFGDRYLHLKASFYYQTDEGLRAEGNGSYVRDDIGGLVFTGQYSADGSDFYGIRLGYMDDYYPTTLPDAELMVRTLRRVTRKMATVSERYGEPTDTAGQLARIADALGTTTKACFGRRLERTSPMYYEGGGEYRWMDANGLRMHILLTIQAFNNPQYSLR